MQQNMIKVARPTSSTCKSETSMSQASTQNGSWGFYVDSEKSAAGLGRPNSRSISLTTTFLLSVGPTNQINISANKIQPSEKEKLENICYGLSCLDSFPPYKAPHTIFGLHELFLTVKSLGGARFSVTTPPPAPVKSEEAKAQGAEKKGTFSLEKEDPFIKLLPASCQTVSEKASPLGLVPKLLPPNIISQQARYVGSSFWTWLCIVDDLTETLVGDEWTWTEEDLLRVFDDNYEDESVYNAYNSDCVKVSLALRGVIENTVVGSKDQRVWRDSFNAAIREVMIGFREERPLIDSDNITMQQWMRLRVITISTRPFFILARADIGLPATVSSFGNPLASKYNDLIADGTEGKLTTIRKIECLLQTILGLQNDILGWEKDAATNNPLSAIQVLIKQGVHQAIAVNDVIGVHNSLVFECVTKAQEMWNEPTNCQHVDGVIVKSNRFFEFFRASSLKKEEDEVRLYLQVILGFAHGMAHWMAVSKRYLA
ncbi:hypothetical protein EX30DRAFT_251685 [Ascodesmis nigricans]|uniref:Terpenoid synthase n=1 Tax=Ascodesmis nigricans TaxID=341454 RepID=A0A4S2MYE7_9PEZI|nr:hypothetical protein EX30DRAFT_251685 [Ascodesmis nigricans]